MEFKIGTKCELHCGLEAVVEVRNENEMYLRLNNGDYFRYNIKGVILGGGESECDDMSEYNLLDGSMDVWHIIR